MPKSPTIENQVFMPAPRKLFNSMEDGYLIEFKITSKKCEQKYPNTQCLLHFQKKKKLSKFFHFQSRFEFYVFGRKIESDPWQIFASRVSTVCVLLFWVVLPLSSLDCWHVAKVSVCVRNN